MLQFDKNNEPYIVSYIRQFLDSLKFELNGCIDSTISRFGFSIIFVLVLFSCLPNEYYWGTFSLVIILLFLAKYLHSEINDSVSNLHQLREELSQRIKKSSIPVSFLFRATSLLKVETNKDMLYEA